MRSDINEILIKLGFSEIEKSSNILIDSLYVKSFRFVRDNIAVSLSMSFYDIIGIPSHRKSHRKNTYVFLIERMEQDESDILLAESFIDRVDYDQVRMMILSFFRSDIRERSLNYLLD